MAKIKFGAIVTDMRNKVGSQVFSKNRYGAYVRSSPLNVVSSTPAQVAVRSRFATFSTAWRSLTQLQRDCWNNAVIDFMHTDVFGATVRPSGFDLYVKLNCNLDQVGIAPISIPPAPTMLAFIASISLTATELGPVVTLDFDSSNLTSDYTIVVSATAPISAGKRYVKNLLRQIAVLPWNTATPCDITSEYVTKFGAPTGDSRISMSLVVVNNISGLKSAPVYGTCIVAPPAGLDYTQALDTGIPLE